ncbi:MAG: hypothetical protein COT00_04940 [Candidatus Omnitrophica bacterium CG07_land_8_20_14_0_80_50_8]|nr:MAG: hypothetical protein COT00_04940 [Candidatus Omnitrophica bacterium CG07_land_8_20_14_0_80_50_8]
MISLVIFIAVIATGFQSTSWNDLSRLASIDSLMYFHIPWVDHSLYFNYGDIIYHQGHFYSDKMPMLSWYSFVLMYPIKFFLDFHSVMGQKLMYFLITLTSSGLSVCLIFVILVRIAKLLGQNESYANSLSFKSITGTLIIPYIGVYISSLVEAVLGLGVFYILLLYREKTSVSQGILSGLLIGICFTIHPLSGAAFTLSTIIYYFARRRFKQGLLCAGTIIIFIGLFLGLHAKIYNQVLPLYFSPEKYTYLKKDGTLRTTITVPGLKRAKLENQLKEVGIKNDRIQETLREYDSFRNESANPFKYIADIFYLFDYVTFTPLTILCFFFLLKLVFKSDDKYRAEFLWVFISIVTIFAGMLYLRAQPGTCFGNRYVIPVLPIVVATSAVILNEKRRYSMFNFFFCLSFPIMLPGTLRPCRFPGHYFKLNIVVPLAAVLALTLIFTISAIKKGFYEMLSFFENHRIFTFIIVAGIIALELILFFIGTPISTGDLIRIQCYVGIFFVWSLYYLNKRSDHLFS